MDEISLLVYHTYLRRALLWHVVVCVVSFGNCTVDWFIESKTLDAIWCLLLVCGQIEFHFLDLST